MAIISRYQVAWTGGVGGPGVTTFYFNSTLAIPGTEVKAFFSPLAGAIPTGITLTFPSAGLNIDDATGLAVGNWTATAPSPLVATGAGNYSAATGAVVNWRTGVFAGGRELRGRTFIVPMVSGAFDATGGVSTSTRTSIATGVTSLLAAANDLLVWSRKAGTSATVTTGSAPAKSAVMRSRRD